jgi:hypothetical protein
VSISFTGIWLADLPGATTVILDNLSWYCDVTNIFICQRQIQIVPWSNCNSNMTSFFQFVNKRAIYRLSKWKKGDLDLCLSLIRSEWAFPFYPKWAIFQLSCQEISFWCDIDDILYVVFLDHHANCLVGVMMSIFTSGKGQTRDYKIDICCCSVKHTALRSKRQPWLCASW